MQTHSSFRIISDCFPATPAELSNLDGERPYVSLKLTYLPLCFCRFTELRLGLGNVQATWYFLFDAVSGVHLGFS